MKKLTDKERLDWLSKKAGNHAVAFIEGVFPARYYIDKSLRFMVIAGPDKKIPSIRAAIDAAIRDQRKALLKAERIGKGEK